MIPSVQITPEGYFAPTREEVTAALWQMMREAFGSNLNQDARTPQGQLVTSLTAALVDRDDQFIELANNFDPRYATGKFQEALAAIYFIEKADPTFSVVRLQFTGLNGAVVPAGVRVVDDNDVEWITTQAGTIDFTGMVEVFAQCTVAGPVTAAIGTITQIVDIPENVDLVTNNTPAVPGSLEESRTDFEIRRAESVAANSQLTNNAVYGAVRNLDGVIDARVVDNPTDDAITVGVTNYPMQRNSLLVSVLGGDDYAIAGEIMKKGGTGCSFVGNTEVLWKDTEAWDDGFPPEYNVKFLRPDSIPVYFDVRVSDYSAITFVQLRTLRETILSQFNSGQNRARIGGKIVPALFNCGLDPALGIIEIKASIDNATWVSVLEFGIDQMPTTAMNMINASQYTP